MMVRSWIAACAVLSILLSGCGGGGGNGGSAAGAGGTSSAGNISISPTSVQFVQDGGALVPSQDVTVTFNGAGVAAGYAPGVTQPNWLFVSNGIALSGTQARFSITAVSNSGLAFGTYTSSIRFATGTSLTNATGYVDLPVTFEYRQGFGTQPSAFPFAFTEFAGNPGSTTPASGQIAITGTGIDWQASATQPWISLSSTQGTGAATVVVGITRPPRVPGSYQGEVVVTNNRNSSVARWPVNYTVTAAQMTLDKTSLAFTVNAQTTNAGIASTITLSDQLSGSSSTGDLSWQASVNVPWLQLSATSGRTAPSALLTATLPTTQLEQLKPGFYSGILSIVATDRAGQSQTRTIPLSMEMQLPYVRTAVPTVRAQNSAGSVRITGEGLEPSTFSGLRVGATTPSNVTWRFSGGTEAILTLPAMAAGQYPIKFNNALGLQRTNATLVVKSIATPGAGVIVSSGAKSRLLYDRQRARLYAVDTTDHEIERFEWNSTGSNWTTLASISVPGLVDADLERSGRNLILVTSDTIQRVPLDVGTPLANTLYTLTDRTCGRSFFHIAMPDDDEALLTLTQTSCAGGAEQPIVFDLIRGSVVVVTPDPPAITDGIIVSSRDEFWSYLGRTKAGSPMNSLLAFASPSNYPFGIWSTPDPVLALDSDPAGNNILVNNEFVDQLTNSTFYRTATLPAPVGRVAKLAGGSSAGPRIYSYIHEPAGSRYIDVRDLTWSGASFATVASLPVTSDLGDIGRAANLTTTDNVAMTLAEQDGVLFVSGPSRIEVLLMPP